MLEELNNLRTELDQCKSRILELEETCNRLSELTRLKRHFILGFCHEMRTPLINILHTIDSLAATSLTVEQNEHLSVIRYNGEQAFLLKKDLLELFREDTENPASEAN